MNRCSVNLENVLLTMGIVEGWNGGMFGELSGWQRRLAVKRLSIFLPMAWYKSRAVHLAARQSK
jgi:hypothetical protein